MISMKIKKSIKNGMFFTQLFNKMHSCFPLYFIKNKNVRFKNRVCKTYYKYKRKYKKLIDEGVQDSERSRNSKKVWICWFQGEENAPDLVKACIESVRRAMPEKDIIILTDNNIYQYANFPDYIVNKRKNGRISDAHFSDLLRVELLCQYGGTWIDATVLCTANSIPSYLIDSKFFVYKQLNLTNLDNEPIVCSSWLISSVSNHKILLLTRKLLWQYWKDSTHVENYFLFHIFLSIAAKKYEQLWNEIPLYNNHSPHELFKKLEHDYTENEWEIITKKSDFHKLSHHVHFSSEGNTIYNFIINKFLPR